MGTRELVFGALLVALALVIPLAFGGFLGVVVPPFSATLASHVPVMISMLLGPWTAVLVGLGSALGFLVKLGPVIAARAAMHAVFAGAGAVLVKRGLPFWKALAWTLPVHAFTEALIVLPFGFTLERAGIVVGLGTALHHLVDAVIALAVVRAVGLAQRSLGKTS
ncbi:MAG TPA: ECF transporter S component [Firmicutes bacterium]|nr:ECF transporter S component [Bacillota bacterium]